jgi:hypothetical protein
MAEEKQRHVMGETKNGKKIQIIRDNMGNWDVAFDSGGEVPPALKGKFTGYNEAKIAINSYLVSKS